LARIGIRLHMKITWLAVLFMGVASMSAAEIGIEFSGVLGTGQDMRVALTNTATGTSDWVVIGKAFAGYTVESYDAKTDTVTVAKEGKQHRLPLKQAKVRTGAAKPPPDVEKAILNNLRQLCAAADQFYLENGKTSVTYDELVGPTKYVKVIEPRDGENYRAIVFAQGKPLKVTTSGGYTMSYDP
jgi:hypothetical protein